MDLIKIVNANQSKISGGGILIEYNLFFMNLNERLCRFAIDDNEELLELNNAIFEIQIKDVNAEIFVSTYGISFTNEIMYIYGDTLWINTSIGIEELNNLFRNYSKVKPSDIALLKEDEKIDGILESVVLEDGKVEDYELFINRRQISKIKSLYWN